MGGSIGMTAAEWRERLTGIAPDVELRFGYLTMPDGSPSNVPCLTDDGEVKISLQPSHVSPMHCENWIAWREGVRL